MSEAKLPPGFVLDSLAPDSGGLPPGFVMDAPTPAKKQSQWQQMQGSPGDRAEVLAAGVTGAVATPLSGIAGLAGAILPGPEGQGADWQRKTKAALSYQIRQPEAQKKAEMVFGLPIALGAVGDYLGEKTTDVTGSPALGAGLNAGLNMLPGAGLKAGRGAVVGAMENATRLAKRSETINATRAAAQEAGYVETTGTGHIAQEATLRNQPVTDKLSRRASQLDMDEDINITNLSKARERMAAPYREIAAISPTAKSALEELKQTRSDAQDLHKFYDAHPDPKVLKEARRLDAEADQWEGLIDQEAARIGRADLLPRLQKARADIARNYEVQRALNTATGEVDAKVLARRLDNGAPLDGDLKTIAAFALGPGQRVTRDASKVGVGGGGQLGAIASATLAAEGYMRGGWKGAAAGAALPYAALGVRRFMLSDLARSAPRGAQGQFLSLADLATRPGTQAAAALTPSLGLRPPPEED